MTPADDPGPSVANLGYARVDIQRSKRQGIPETVLCQGKSPSQVAAILEVLVRFEGVGIATKANRRVYQGVRALRWTPSVGQVRGQVKIESHYPRGSNC